MSGTFRMGMFVLALLAGILVATQPVTATAGVTPNDAFSSADQISRSLDVILADQGLAAVAERATIEKGLGPFHVYQIEVACVQRLSAYQKQAGHVPVPQVISTPTKYTPADVLKLSELILLNVRQVAAELGVSGLPQDAGTFEGKTPTDVFAKFVGVFSRLRALAREASITPNEVYAEAVRSVGDARSILTHIDEASRYRIDVAASDAGLTPDDVFAKCLEARRALNTWRSSLDLDTTPVPNANTGRALTPEDVFVQTQILIAELNLLKLGSGTVSATALAIPVSGMTPSDVHEQVSLLQYLVEQADPLKEMVMRLAAK